MMRHGDVWNCATGQCGVRICGLDWVALWRAAARAVAQGLAASDGGDTVYWPVLHTSLRRRAGAGNDGRLRACCREYVLRIERAA